MDLPSLSVKRPHDQRLFAVRLRLFHVKSLRERWQIELHLTKGICPVPWIAASQ